MANGKKSFVLYCDLLHTVKLLPKEQIADLFVHILEYVNDLNPQSDDLIMNVAFEPIKRQLKRDLSKFNEIKEKRSRAGSIGGKQSQANQASVKQNQANQAVTVNDTVNVNENDTINTNGAKPRPLTDRIEEFKKGILDFNYIAALYSEDMLNDFIEYWTEHGVNDRKARWEKEKSFGVGRRLATWYKRSPEGKKEVDEIDWDAL